MLSMGGRAKMRVNFWGTRGSIAKPGASTVRFGGNRSCVEIRSDSGTIAILDCGTGLTGSAKSLWKADRIPCVATSSSPIPTGTTFKEFPSSRLSSSRATNGTYTLHAASVLPFASPYQARCSTRTFRSLWKDSGHRSGTTTSSRAFSRSAISRSEHGI